MADDPAFVTQLDREIDRMRTELRRAEEFREWWVKRPGVQPAPGTNGGAPDVGPAGRSYRGEMTLAQWIRSVLTDGAALTAAQIREAVIAAGWPSEAKNKDNMVRKAIIRLTDKGELVREGKKYHLADLS